jgi:beta-mannosidase
VSGLYGEAYIGSCEIGRIDYLTTDQVCKGDVWELRVTVEYYAYNKAKVPFEISIAGVEFSMDVAVQTGKNLLRHTVEIRDPDLWWPAGYGEQKLYLLSVRVGGQHTNKNVGFRTVSVILEDDDAGRSMTFAVNGRKIFCKGANWIPVDALPARQTSQRYERLLADSVAANMNMLRLWGGGQYEREIFYKLCDEKGILVWHDFMFSCSTYPSSEWFLKEVAEEVEHQVKRLKDHPCIALWCGNNENLGALQWYPESRANLARYLVDYDRLYEGVVGRIVRRLDPGRPWWPSSPSAGQGDYSDNWHDDSKGDMHYWSVWHEGKDFKAYYDVTPRFCSEFGFQSFPSLGTVRRFAPEDQWNVTSPIIEHHQRHPRGNTVIIETMTRYFRMPSSFEGFLYLSQVQQALAMKMAVEYWRSRRPVCMGILYWQLDDLWPVASWSSIEYSGKWKLLHYAARKFYAPVHVAVYLSGDKCIDIVGINDTFNRIRGTLEFQLIDFSGRILQEQSMDVDLAPESATQLFVYGLEKLQAEAEEVFVHVLFSQWDRRSGIGRSTIENELFLCPPKRCCLQDPGITAKVRPIEGAFAVELQTERPAFYVSLDVDDLPGIFEDNLFTLLPGEKKTVRFTPRPFSVTEDLPTEESAAVYSQPRNPSAENPLAPLAPLASFSTNLKVFHLQGTYS